MELSNRDRLAAKLDLNLPAGDFEELLTEVTDEDLETVVDRMVEMDLLSKGTNVILSDGEIEAMLMSETGGNVYGVCMTRPGEPSLIILMLHNRLVLAHELTHAMIRHCKVTEDKPHGMVFKAMMIAVAKIVLDVLR